MIKNKKLKSELPELPDCVISYIFSKLGLKDLVKTSTLSKRWLHEWGLRMDLNFDPHNMVQELPNSRRCLSQFATRLDQFMLHYQGAMIRSIRVNFPLGDEDRDVIDRMIFKGIAKGVKRLELLFSYETNDVDFEIEPYQFTFILLSDADSLMYLHLEKCRLVAPMDFSGLKNLRTLVLHLVDVEQYMLRALFSNCIHLVDFALDDCEFNSDLEINSPTLLNLKIVNCGVNIKRNIYIIASNLSSFEYSYIYYYNYGFHHSMNIEAHMLSKFSYSGSVIFKPVGFSGLKNVTTVVLDGLRRCLSKHIVPHLFSECLQLVDVTFKNCNIISNLNITSTKLRHLNIIDCGFPDIYPNKIAIDALNLSSFEYSGGFTMEFDVTAPRLLKVFWNTAERTKYLQHTFGAIARSSNIENLAMITSPSQISELKRVLVQFQNLRQLELFIKGEDDPIMDYSWILDIAMASQHLQKLSLTIRKLCMKKSHMVGFNRQRREYAGFFHKDLKYVELRGCVCSMNVIELASHLLRSVNSLQKIIFSSHYKFYIGAGSWTKGSYGCRCFDRNLIHELLKDEVNKQCQLIIL